MDSKEKLNHGFFPTSSVPSDDDPTCLRIPRSSSSAANMEAYMQSFLQQQQQHKGLMMNAMSPQLPPPVAMSLRARETAAMSLKHIFDQKRSNGSSIREQECSKSTQGKQMGGFQGIRNQSMPDLRKRVVPELDLSFRKAQDSNFANAQTGFGSPISTPTATPSNQDLVSQPSLPLNSQLMQHNHMSPSVLSARLTHSSKQPTSQMTVFYSGSVNVYDDVPADKAHAIMLLAGNSWSANYRSPACPAGPVSSGCTEVTAKERALSPMRAAVSQQEALPSSAKTSSNGGGIARNGLNSTSAAPAILSVASPPPSPAPVSLADSATTTQTGAPARRSHAGIELPHARKASLARFLEKRKDRVQVPEAGGGEKGAGEGGESVSCSGKPHDDEPTPPNSKRPCIRSCSTSPPSQSTSNISSKEDNTDTNPKVLRSVAGESPPKKAMMNEHCFFHQKH